MRSAALASNKRTRIEGTVIEDPAAVAVVVTETLAAVAIDGITMGSLEGNGIIMTIRCATTICTQSSKP